MVFTNKDLNKNTYTLGEVANFLSVHPKTLQKKDREGLIPFDRTSTNRRFLTIENLIKLLDENNLFYDDSKLIKHDVIYARVSSPKQRKSGDLDRQADVILKENQNLQNLIILKEVGSGLNDQRPKLQQLIKMVLNKEVNKVYITYKDRLTRFGFNYFKYIFEELDVEIVILYEENYETTEQQFS
ncbi:MAG: IS607 family transposase [Mollicutes bacterium]|nr:IS607 family transposase [Mollicutes bacterium]